MNNSNNFYNRIKENLAIFFALLGAFLLITGLYTAPLGVIDSSVQYTLGMIFLFIASLLGMDGYVKYQLESLKQKLTKFNNTENGDKNNKDSQE